MKKLLLILFVILSVNGFSQEREKDRDYTEAQLQKMLGFVDRAGGTHNGSNIGLFFENRGKLYPRRLSQGPSGEFPINSGKHYIYRINPMVGIPGNVIQGRYTTNEEWEAVGGYHNNELSRIALSNEPATWHPVNGWPFKDAEGKPVIKSDQDSYCAYDDAKNTVSPLGIKVGQRGYTYGVKFAQNIIFYVFTITNTSTVTHNNLYFGLYNDIDVGNVSGGIAEYNDDKIGFNKEKNFLYFYDAKGFSSEWPDQKSGYFGIAFLKTPKVGGVELGITDMHYNLYNDDRDVDSIQYGLMASSPNLYNSSLGSKYFHLGTNTSLNYDDTSTIPAGGLDLVATISSGPYTIAPGDTLEFVTAIIAGNTLTETNATLSEAYKILQFDFEIAKPPQTPRLAGFAGDKKNILFWDDKAEKSLDRFTGLYDFEGYRVYRSVDKGLSWTLINDFDVVNQSGLDRGVQYSYVDTVVTNGFEYWYSVTAYDKGDSLIESLESPIGKNLSTLNTVALIPVSAAAGRTPLGVQSIEHNTDGKSNYDFIVLPVDADSIKNNYYDIGFGYTLRYDKGSLQTAVTVLINDSTKTEGKNYGIQFLAPNKFNLIDLATGDFIKENQSYASGATYSINAGMRIKLQDTTTAGNPAYLPKAGDYISINFSTHAVRNGTDTVIYPRPLTYEKPQATSDGVTFTVSKPEIIKSVSKVGGTDNVVFSFTLSDEALVKSLLYIVRVTGKGTDAGGAPFVSVYVDSANGIDTNRLFKIDTLYNFGTFEFDGIRGLIDFKSSSAPAAGNAYSVEIVKPQIPNVKDKYRITLNSAQIQPKITESMLKNIKVVPNPYLVSSLYEPEFGELRREPLRQLQFINLPSDCTIYIFTLDADLIKTIYHSSTAGTAYWDLRTDGGREIAPGMYIYVVKTKDSEYINKFAVIK